MMFGISAYRKARRVTRRSPLATLDVRPGSELFRLSLSDCILFLFLCTSYASAALADSLEGDRPPSQSGSLPTATGATGSLLGSEKALVGLLLRTVSFGPVRYRLHVWRQSRLTHVREPILSTKKGVLRDDAPISRSACSAPRSAGVRKHCLPDSSRASMA